jgi:hypothetical protein
LSRCDPTHRGPTHRKAAMDGSLSGCGFFVVLSWLVSRFDRVLWRPLATEDGKLQGGADGDVVGVGEVVGFGDLGVLVGVAVEEQADG